jgi:ATP-dependent helicase/nuclease subunit B
MALNAVEAALAGATVLTSSTRLSRALTEQVQQAQRGRGLSVWRSSSILPLDAFVSKCFEDLLYSGRRGPFPVLLNPAQETALWEQIILRTDGERLLQPYATAAAARTAFELATAWRVPAGRGGVAATEDCEAFNRWVAAFLERTRERNWLDGARLMDFVRARIDAGEIAVPPNIALAGFDELTPQQREFLEALRGRADDSRGVQFDLFAAPARAVIECDRPSHRSRPVHMAPGDAAQELGAAAEWARDRLAANPRARIGVVVPELSSHRGLAERIFSEVLQPGAFADGPAPYHLSAGPPLADYPLVRAAMLILRAAQGELSVPATGLLLRSPFVKGGISEREARARMDVALRDNKLRKDRLEEQVRPLAALRREWREIPETQPPSAWSRSFARLLTAAGWPGDREPDSHEYQTIAAWNDALSTLSTLDIVLPSLQADAALSRLRRIAEAVTFQPENEGAPIQIMGTLEAAGLSFDHLWITGLDADTMPSRARPNPFLPLNAQIDKGLPHSTVERELKFARLTLSRLAASAPDVVLSHAQRLDDQELSPSPLLAELSPDEVETPVRDGLHAEAASLEEMEDETAPPLASANSQGGAWLLKAMAACPFQAFAQVRLNAKGLEEPEFGFSARDKGSGVHKVMQAIWTELASQDNLRLLSADELQALVARHLGATIPGSDAFSSVERERLQTILVNWLSRVEMQRPRFTVEGREQDREAEIGGLRLKVRVDRIDRIADGRLIIVDYKTGQVKTTAWQGERPAEPQLPLYAATCQDPLGALLIAQISRDASGYTGLSDGAVSARPMRSKTDSLKAERVEWTRVLTALAEDFRAGVARVDPAGDACRFCDYRALCRVDEIGALADEENGNAPE